MRIIRTMFYLSLAAFLMPSPPESVQPAGADPALTTPQMFFAATNAISDLRAFCGRQPGVCDTAQYLAVKIETKAKYSARLLYEWANEASSPSNAPPSIEADTFATSSTQVASADSEGLSQNTLRLDDLVPEWRAPRETRKS
ncbi:hypothetical protein BH10PSE7_BH10PSE7_23470 [soil metagenome]